MKPTPLNFPKFSFRFEKRKNVIYVWDDIRKKWLVLTPEEWVRQHVVQYLIQYKNYPSNLFSLESKVDVNGKTNRSDAVVFSSKLSPLILVECKAPQIKVNNETIYQAVRYNKSINAPYIILTNGKTHYVIETIKNSFKILTDIPDFSMLS